MKLTYEELEDKVARLESKLSPLEDKDFTATVAAKLAEASAKMRLTAHRRSVRGVECISAQPGEIYLALFLTEPNLKDITTLGRSLQALGWVRGAKRGNLIFTIPVEEL